MKKTGMLTLFGTLVIAALAGCGGNVKVDPPGGDGGSDAGGAGPGGSGPGSSTSSSMPSPPVAFCGQVCAAAQEYGCLEGSSVSECLNGCLQLFQQYPDCNDELYALYGCAMQNLSPGCEPVSSCDAEATAFGDCAGSVSTCGTDTCAGDGQSCSCQGQCGGSYLEADCKQGADGIFCSCAINGEQVGTCYDGSLSCDILSSCCSSYFFGE